MLDLFYQLRSRSSSFSNLQKLEMIDFLEADDIWIVSSDFFDHPEPPSLPVQRLGRAASEVVVLRAESWKIEKWV